MSPRERAPPNVGLDGGLRGAWLCHSLRLQIRNEDLVMNRVIATGVTLFLEVLSGRTHTF